MPDKLGAKLLMQLNAAKSIVKSIISRISAAPLNRINLHEKYDCPDRTPELVPTDSTGHCNTFLFVDRI